MAPLVAAAAILAGTLFATASVATPDAERAAGDAPEQILFPIVGSAQWTDDFGDPRPQGSHEGNDILSDWRAPVVAVEAGKVEIHNGSAAAGCMLYLYGRSGTTYLYIHLNNDRTEKNDGKGGCVPGVAFAPGLATGDRVQAGELLGYVGSSGDAGATNHLHFELHPNDGGAVSPFRWLKRAQRLLYVVSNEDKALAASGGATLTLEGTVASIGSVTPEQDAQPTDEQPPAETEPAEPPPEQQALDTTTPPPPPPPTGRLAAGENAIAIEVSSVALSSGGSWSVERDLTLLVPADAVVERTKGKKTRAAPLSSAEAGEPVTITTGPIQLSLATQIARPGALSAATVELQGP